MTNYVPINNTILRDIVRCFKARCTPEKLTILTKHSKTFFINHVVKNIVNYQLQKLYIKRTSIKGLNYTFATWCHSALKYLWRSIVYSRTCKSNNCTIQEQCDCKLIIKEMIFSLLPIQ